MGRHLYVMLFAVVAGASVLCTQTAKAVPAWGEAFDFSQPDGSSVMVRVWGDEFYRRAESVDGYTLVRDKETKWLCYADLSADRTELISTGHIYNGNAISDAVMNAIRQHTNSKGLSKSLKIRPETRRQIVAKRRKALFGDISVPKEAFGKLSAAGGDTAGESVGQAAISGNIVGLTMLVDFPGTPATISQTTVDNFCNQVGYNGDGNNGSVRDYYYDVSANKLVYTNVVTPYMRADYEMAYYDSASDGARTLIKECFRKLIDSGFDISGATGSSSTILALNVLYAGSWGSDDLWPHRWVISSTYPYTYSYGGYTIKDYEITGMQSYLKLGTFCHENGHLVCGWPDLYDYDYDSKGVGYFCLMASGSYAGGQLNPAVPCAYLRAEQGWDTVTDITSEPAAALNHQANSNTCFRYSHPTDSKEYFLIESRIKSGRNANYPDEGLVIWHVDEDGDNDNQEMTPTSHYLVSLEQADGLFHLENNNNGGGSGDLFHAGYKDTFDDTTLPDAKWWSGSNSDLLIHEISAVGSTMSFIYGIIANPAPPVAVDVNEITSLDSPVTITLNATDEGLPNPPGILSYIITSQPAHGWLAEPETPAIPIGSVPYILVGNTVIYTPRFGCEHPTSFTYVANDSGTAPDGGDSNEAAVNISFQAEPVALYTAMMDTDPGWTYEGQWIWGTPAGSGGSTGNPDPASGFTGSNVIGYNLAGDYTTMNVTEWATTPVFDCTDTTNVTLTFRRWLNVGNPAGGQPPRDHAYIEVSNDGSSWSTIWQNTTEVTDSSWQLLEYDISAVADGQPTVYVRWGMGPTNNYQNYSGWNIDDVTIAGEMLPTPPMAGDFEPDCDVDLDDLMHVVSYWLAACGECDGTDLIADGIVNLADFQALAQNWLPLADDYIMDFRWPFDTDASEVLLGYDGTLMNGALIDTSDYAVGTGALSLDGVNDYVEIPLQGLNSVVFTVSFWARVEGGTGTWRAAFCSRHSDITGYVIYASNDNKWEFWTGGSGGAWQIAEGPAVQIGEWTHVAASFQPTGGPNSEGVYTGTKTFYINGQEVLQQTGTTYKMNTVQPVTIGRANDAATFYFNGSIDDVRIYNRALSPEEIAAIAQ